MWVELGLAIHHEQVVVMTVMQFQADCPAAIGTPVHWVRCRIPAVEIACEADMRSPRRIAKEVHVMDIAFCGVADRRSYLGILGFES